MALTQRTDERTAGLFVSWIRHHGRSADLAPLLGLRPVFVAVGRSGNRWTAPLRYALQAATTIRVLLRERPAVLVVMAPPDTLIALALVYARLARATLVIDAHTAAVHDSSGRLRARFVWLAERANLTLVTSGSLVTELDHASVRAFRLDDPIARASVGGQAEVVLARPRVVVPASWYSDEPWRDLIEAAADLPDVDLVFTGRAPAAAIAAASGQANVTLTGFLPAREYGDLLASADVIVALTTRENTMQRAGYEALARGIPLVTSDTAVLRDFFDKGAVHAEPDSKNLAIAIEAACRDAARLRRELAELLVERRARFDADLGAVRSVLDARAGGRR